MSLAGTGQTNQLFDVLIPDNTISFTIVAENLGSSFGAVAALRDPNGTERVGDLKPYAFDDTLAVQIPNSPDIEIVPGTWQIAVVNFQAPAAAEPNRLSHGTVKRSP